MTDVKNHAGGVFGRQPERIRQGVGRDDLSGAGRLALEYHPTGVRAVAADVNDFRLAVEDGSSQVPAGDARPHLNLEVFPPLAALARVRDDSYLLTQSE